MSVTCQKMNRRELLNYINEISFAVDDTKLFLDTHPWDLVDPRVRVNK